MLRLRYHDVMVDRSCDALLKQQSPCLYMHYVFCTSKGNLKNWKFLAAFQPTTRYGHRRKQLVSGMCHTKQVLKQCSTLLQGPFCKAEKFSFYTQDTSGKRAKTKLEDFKTNRINDMFANTSPYLRTNVLTTCVCLKRIRHEPHYVTL